MESKDSSKTPTNNLSSSIRQENQSVPINQEYGIKETQEQQQQQSQSQNLAMSKLNGKKIKNIQLAQEYQFSKTKAEEEILKGNENYQPTPQIVKKKVKNKHKMNTNSNILQFFGGEHLISQQSMQKTMSSKSSNQNSPRYEYNQQLLQIKNLELIDDLDYIPNEIKTSRSNQAKEQSPKRITSHSVHKCDNKQIFSNDLIQDYNKKFSTLSTNVAKPKQNHISKHLGLLKLIDKTYKDFSKLNHQENQKNFDEKKFKQKLFNFFIKEGKDYNQFSTVKTT